MGHGHGQHAHHVDIRVPERARAALLAALLVLGILTLVGLVAWWPDGSAVARVQHSAHFAAPGSTYLTGEVRKVSAACPSDQRGRPGCDELVVALPHGVRTAVRVPPEVLASGLSAGDEVQVLRTPAGDGVPVSYSYVTTERSGTLLWLGLLFVLVVVAVARWRGAMAVVGLGLGALVVWKFLLPALLAGEPAVGVALVTASSIMYVVLYSTHGLSLRTSVALLGTLLGALVTAGVSLVAVSGAHLTGISDESGGILSSLAGHFNFSSMLVAAVIIAGLGVLNDVTITQASAVWELRAASPTASRWDVFRGAMRIGRDHIASTIYTIVFAYAGTALVLLMLLQVYDRSLLGLVGTEQLADEVVRTFTTSIGLVLAVPITTALGAAMATPSPAGVRSAAR